MAVISRSSGFAPHRKPRKRRGRIRWVLSRLARFVEKHDYWPTCPQLALSLGRGSRWTCWRDMRRLTQAGMVKCEHRVWIITADGWWLLGLPPRTPTRQHKPNPQSRKKRNAEERAIVTSGGVTDLISPSGRRSYATTRNGSGCPGSQANRAGSPRISRSPTRRLPADETTRYGALCSRFDADQATTGVCSPRTTRLRAYSAAMAWDGSRSSPTPARAPRSCRGRE
jgi:hypothetical protein